MASIRSRGTKPERALEEAIAATRYSFRTHAEDLPGTPDIVFDRHKLAVFVNGCFWHGCPRCYRRPRTNRRYWMKKLEGNRRRDNRVRHALWRSGWRVTIIWECKLNTAVGRILARLRSGR